MLKKPAQSRQPEVGEEESKGPAGLAIDSTHPAHPPLKLLVLADSKASFYRVHKNGGQTELIKDESLPSYPGATIA